MKNSIDSEIRISCAKTSDADLSHDQN